jgi:hypothetical protein
MTTHKAISDDRPLGARPVSSLALRDWRQTFGVVSRRLPAGHPFSLPRAALLLFGINRLSVDLQCRGSEPPKPGFPLAAWGGAWKRFCAGLRSYRRLLELGVLVLASNLALSVAFRLTIEGGADRGEQVGRIGWLAVLPALQGLAIALPQARQRGDTSPQRRWLPLVIFNGWILASGVHLWCVGYVGDLAIQPYLLAPALWALAWTVGARLADFTPRPVAPLRAALLAAPTLAIVPGAFAENSTVFLALAGLNTVIYTGLWLRTRDQRGAMDWALVSLACVIAAVPESLGRALLPDFTRGQAVAAALGVTTLLCAAASRRLADGMGAAVVAMFTTDFLFQQVDFHLALQTGLAVLLIHSLRWVDVEQKGAQALRGCTAVTWTVLASWRTHGDGTAAGWIVPSAAVLVFSCWLVARIVVGRWEALHVPTGAACSFRAAPVNHWRQPPGASPVGLAAAIGTFLLFGLGTLPAPTKAR